MTDGIIIQLPRFGYVNPITFEGWTSDSALRRLFMRRDNLLTPCLNSVEDARGSIRNIRSFGEVLNSKDMS